MAIEQEVGPPPEIRFRRALQFRSELRELWEARPTIYSLTERDLRSRYSQMVLGFLWNIIGPVLLTVFITVLLNRARIVRNVPQAWDDEAVPTAVFVYTAMMLWSFFSGSLSSGGTSIVSNGSLLNKVYVPREVFPIAQILNQGVDAICAASAFIVILIANQFLPAPTFFWAPIPIAIAVMFALACAILLPGLTVYFRDMRQAIPLVIQLGLFANPIAWDLQSQISNPTYQKLYCAINPLGGAIDGLRQCLLYGNPPDLALTAISGGFALLYLSISYVAFKQMEAGFADVA